MKVVSPKHMAYMESQAYRDGALESVFMEEAGSGVALVAHDFVERHQLDHHVLLLCGKGNNGGDAYVAGVHMLHLDYEVMAIQLAPIETCSKLCQENYHRFLMEGGQVQHAASEEEARFPTSGIIIDGIFGTGFYGEVTDFYADIIRQANESLIPIISVDIPSGLNGETGEVNGEAIIAAETAFLTLPKTGFFINKGWNHVGKLRFVDFGLGHQYIDEYQAEMMMLTKETVRPWLPPIVRDRHKYQRGLVVGLGGSPGMPGAALMSSAAALKGGAGIVRLLHPKGMEAELSSSQPELIKIAYEPSNIKFIAETLNKAAAAFIGPGLGRTESAANLLLTVLPQLQIPCVIDADALTILSQAKVPFPEKTILTPHKGEMERLLKQEHPSPIDKFYLNKCQEYAALNRVTLILKGAPTFIIQPDETIVVSPVGDPGMATAGSGDILTGLLAALLAQGLTPYHAACLGVYIHGLAGEFAALELTSNCVTATDILYYFPEGFRLFEL